jgi:hypothetical protein
VVLEAGLWGERPDLCWALELRVIEKQAQDFRLRAPDEPAARAAFERQHPELVKKRLDPAGAPAPDRYLDRWGRGRGRRDGRGRGRRGRRGMSDVLGPVSAVLEEDLRAAISRGGLVVWLDADDHYTGFVDRLIARRAAGDLPHYDVQAYRGSHLELMLALEDSSGGVDKPARVVHMPGFNVESIQRTPMLELYLAGSRYQKALDTLITPTRRRASRRPRRSRSFSRAPGERRRMARSSRRTVG